MERARNRRRPLRRHGHSPARSKAAAREPRGSRFGGRRGRNGAAAATYKHATAVSPSRPARFSPRRRVARARLAAADDVLLNTGTVAELRQAVDRLHEKYLQLARTSSSRAKFNLNPRFTLGLGLAHNRAMNSYPDISPSGAGSGTGRLRAAAQRAHAHLSAPRISLYQATYHSESPNPWSSRAAVSSLLEILAITARGDSRSDVLKELERQVNVLKEYQTKTGVDPARLKSLMSNLFKLREDLRPSAAISWGPCAIRNF